MDPRLNVTQLEIKFFERGPLPRVQWLAQRQLNPKILYGEGNRTSPRQEATDDAHFPVGLSFDLLGTNVNSRVHLYKEIIRHDVLQRLQIRCVTRVTIMDRDYDRLSMFFNVQCIRRNG